MAFLPLGLNIEETQSSETSQNAPKELREDLVRDGGPGLLDGKEAQQGTLVSTDKAPHNGANGTIPKTNPESIGAEKDNWPEMGMQIIQSVLREAQNKPATSSSGPASSEK